MSGRFTNLINKTDDEVNEFLTRLGQQMRETSGEYDQDDNLIVEYDDFADLLTIARTLWYERGGGVGVPADVHLKRRTSRP